MLRVFKIVRNKMREFNRNWLRFKVFGFNKENLRFERRDQ